MISLMLPLFILYCSLMIPHYIFPIPNYDVLILVANSANAEMNNIVEWMPCNKLTINLTKHIA